MKKYYGRKAWVPDNCPGCGRLRTDLKPMPVTRNTDGKLSYETLTKLTEEVFGGYARGVDRHWFWRMPRWFGRCGACNLEANLRGPSLLQKLAEKSKDKPSVPPLRYQLRT